MAASKTTVDHDEIRRWVEKNGGCPARVKATGRGKGDAGILRIDYPGFSGQDTLVKMGWDEWFEAFDKNNLAFVYQPTSRFSKLVARASVRRGKSATAGRSGASKKTAARATSRTKRTAAKTTTKRASTRTAGAKARAGAKSTARKRGGAAAPRRTPKRTTRGSSRGSVKRAARS